MLSDTQRATLAATLPAVEGALTEITPRFYRGLFDAHPNLLDNLFNQLEVNTFLKDVLRGVIIIAAVAVYALRTRRGAA